MSAFLALLYLWETRSSARGFRRRRLNLQTKDTIIMRLRNLVANIVGFIEFVSSILYLLEKAGISIGFPFVMPVSDLLLDILLVLAIVGAAAFPIWVIYQIWRSKHPAVSPVPTQGTQQKELSTRILGARLDARLEHVHLHVFWPLRRIITHQPEWIQRQGDFPRNKYLVDYKAKKAYSVGAYGWSLLVPDTRIEMHSETRWFPFYQRFWCWKRGFTVIPHAASKADLLGDTQ
jgi:hypothetical protein